MRAPFFLALALMWLLPARAARSSTLLLELRIFKGPVEVTRHTRVSVHRAGDRSQPLVQANGRQGPIELQVPEGIYDVQAIEERDGQVVSIHWAHRLVVMPYPDEKGRHLEVLNFKPGFGALQIRARTGTVPDVTLYSGAGRDRPVATPIKGTGYTLFVVPGGVYDLAVARGARTTRHADLEVPADRTRLWLIPDAQTPSGDQTRRPDSSLTTITTRAMTSRMWISPPTTSRANPSSHRTSRTTTIVHNMHTSPEADRPATLELGLLQSGYRSEFRRS